MTLYVYNFDVICLANVAWSIFRLAISQFFFWRVQIDEHMPDMPGPNLNHQQRQQQKKFKDISLSVAGLDLSLLFAISLSVAFVHFLAMQQQQALAINQIERNKFGVLRYV